MKFRNRLLPFLSAHLSVFVIANLFALTGTADDEPLHIVVFGDSNTAVRGAANVYANHLRDRLDNVRVTNAGVGGNHTSAALMRLEKDVLSKKPDIVVIMFGINDAAVDVWKNPPATKPRIPLTSFENNLRRIVTKCIEADATPILMTPTPLRWSRKTLQLYGKTPYLPHDVEGFNILLPNYAAAVRRVAQQKDVLLFDAWKAFTKAEGGPETLLLSDGMHLNDAGHALVAESILPLIRKVHGAHATPK